MSREGLRELSFALAELVEADRAARPAEQPAERVRVKVAEAVGSNPITSSESPDHRAEVGSPRRSDSPTCLYVSLRVFIGHLATSQLTSESGPCEFGNIPVDIARSRLVTNSELDSELWLERSQPLDGCRQCDPLGSSEVVQSR